MKTKPEKSLNVLFGLNVKKHRLSQKITQAQLAFESNMPREQIVRIEKGQVNISLLKVESIAKALNVPAKVLFEFDA